MRYGLMIGRIVRRLRQSEGRRIARRNALRELDTFLERVRRELRRQFPTIAKDGREVVPNMLPKGTRRCPADGTYLPTPGKFAAHVVSAHGGRCWCGHRPRVYDKFAKEFPIPAARGEWDKRTMKGAASCLRSHFERVKDKLAEHCALGAIGAMAGGNENGGTS